jgi:hypothetical protein
MQHAEFEEKEYEMPLYNELLGSSRCNLWTPGQVFEQYFGIDAALEVNNPLFWSIVGYSAPPRGVILDDYKWGKVWRLIKKLDTATKSQKRPLPHFNVNLLLQVKRPDYLKGTNSDFSHHGITLSYWRFKTTPHQQSALEQISNKLSNRALVAYGCPAFHSLRVLYYHIEKKSLVQTSSFVRALRLAGHKAWIYDSPGMKGIACSEMERVAEDGLFAQIEKLISGIKKSDSTDKERAEKSIWNLNKLSHMLMDAMKEASEKKNPIAFEFIRRFERGMKMVDLKALRPEVISFSIIAGLFEFMRVLWLVAG